MKKIEEPVIDYFQAPENYFWQWTENGEVIEWVGGKTICYREELIPLLKSLLPLGIPPLSSVLLVLSACQDTWQGHTETEQVFQKILSRLEIEKDNTKQILQKKLDDALLFLENIHKLPVQYRTGNQRVVLLDAVFSENKGGISENEFGELLFYFEKGDFDTVLFHKKRTFNTYIFQNHLEYFATALSRYPNTKALELGVRTGLLDLPKALEVEVPILESGDKGILEQLEDDPRTTGLTKLARQLIESLSIPMHALQYNDNLMGGVADISNKGTFDRLLLSELAHDDVVLTARLANNEALYLQREQQPDKKEQERIILVDTTIKMWGLPRVFAFATSLALAQLRQKNISTRIYALAGDDFQAFDFSSKEEIIKALEAMDANLHCGKALRKIFFSEKRKANTEYYLISDEMNFSYVDFQLYFSEIKDRLDYFVKVNREGSFQLSKITEGGQKVIFQKKYDLQELLYHPKSVTKKAGTSDWPEFMQQVQAPLYFPASKVKPKSSSTLIITTHGVVLVSVDQRLLHWTSSSNGAFEELAFIEAGQYHFGNTDTHLFVLVNEQKQKYTKLYRIDKNTHECICEVFYEKALFSKEVFYYEETFFVYNSTQNQTLEIRAANFTISMTVHAGKMLYEKGLKAVFTKHFTIQHVKKFINNGYSVINKARSVFISHDQHLVFDRHVISLSNNTTLQVSENTNDKIKFSKVASSVDLEYDMKGYPNSLVNFYKFAWKDGSEAIMDSRGLLHLKSSDDRIPEITIVLVINQPSACWASDGVVCGNSYFTGMDVYKSMKVAEFYEHYIHKFITTIE
jgi:hypothetical protein